MEENVEQNKRRKGWHESTRVKEYVEFLSPSIIN